MKKSGRKVNQRLGCGSVSVRGHVVTSGDAVVIGIGEGASGIRGHGTQQRAIPLEIKQTEPDKPLSVITANFYFL